MTCRAIHQPKSESPVFTFKGDKLKFTDSANKNYSAVVVELQKFNILPNCDNVQAALIFGNSVIVSKDTKAGDVGLFFPVETQLDQKFLGANNLFRKPEWGNVENDKKGFFEEQGRVKAVKFRGHKSEGFWIPIESLSYTGIPLSEFTVGSEFDKVGDYPICCKYIPARNKVAGSYNKKARQPRLEDRIIDGQFRFHIDTENLRRNTHRIEPHMYLSISSKWHGSSAVMAHILVKRELPWYERLLKRLGVKVQEHEYGYTWSSRRVVKGIAGTAKENSIHYYDSDIWGVVAKEVENSVQRGVTLYGEIVGYTTEGSPIQGGYAYGCQPKTHRFLVYRITTTNHDGKVIELSWNQMKEYCVKYGLEMVKELWYGKASDYFHHSDGIDLREWQQGFLAKLEHQYVNDQMCEFNNLEVPSEGLVLRIECLDEAPSFKLKNFKFLSFESANLDKGVVDIETAESEPVQ